MDAPIAPNLSIQPGLSLQGKGGKGRETIDNVLTNNIANISMLYLEVPVNFVYKIPVTSGNFFIGAGPYAAFGIAAQVKGSSISESGSFKKAELNILDLGLNVLGGYKFSNGFLINTGYGLGLANVIKETKDLSIYNSVLSFGVGFEF